MLMKLLNDIPISSGLIASVISIFPNLAPIRRIQFFGILLLTILAAFSEVVSIGAIIPFLGILTQPERVFEYQALQPVIQYFSISAPSELRFPLTILFIFAICFSAILRFMLLWSQTYFSHACGADLSVKAYRHVLYEDYSFHAQQNSGDIIAAVSTKASNIVQGIILPSLILLSSVFTLVSVLAVLVSIEPTISIITFLGLGGTYGITILLVRRRLSNASVVINTETSNVIKILQEGLGGIRDVIIDGTQTIFCDIFRLADRRKRTAEASVQIISSSPRILIETIGMILMVVLAYGLLMQPDGISTGLPLIGALALGAQRLLPAVYQIYRSIAHIKAGEAYLYSILSLYDRTLPELSGSENDNELEFSESISFIDVSFKYGHDTPWILKGLTFNIPRGSKVGIIGITGSGKSTLVDVFMGLLIPTEGKILIDGIQITKANRKSWQKRIAHVPQSIFLADTTVAENIAFGIPSEYIDLEDVAKAADRAQIANTIENWDKKYNTMVGENGVRISGGQRQRIGIARALYKEAGVMIFDEATSALDTKTEQAVVEAIDNINADITTIMVAHRLSTLSQCDFIIELEQGRIKQVGSFDTVTSNTSNSKIVVV